MINSCTLVGRIGKDPELRYSKDGTPIANFSLAVSRRGAKDGQQDTDWFNVVAFGRSGEFVAQHLDKGSLVGVEGRIQSRNWTTEDGQKRNSVEIVANAVQALESRAEAERRRGGSERSAAVTEGSEDQDDPFADE